MSEPERLLVFGGSFDPIHNGHLFIAQMAAQFCGAVRVLFMPTLRAPHRSTLSASLEQRLAMVRLAIAPNPHFALDSSDAVDDASGYTVDALPRVRQRYPQARIFFLVGEDSLTRSRWHRFDEVVAMVEQLLVAPRDASDIVESDALKNMLAACTPATRAKILLLPSPRITISATSVRERVADAQSIRYLVPESVRLYIDQNQLYRQGAA